MNRLSKFLFVLALATVLALVAMVSRQQLRTPREVLDEVLVQLEGDAFDEALVLRQLQSAIRRAESMDASLPVVQELCAELRLTRGKLLMGIGANTDARTDLEVILERYRPGDSEVRRMLVEIDTADGDISGALARLQLLLDDQPTYGPAWVEYGRMHQLLANQALDLAKDRLRYVLITEDASLAEGHLESLAARAPQDPLRTSDILELRLIFPASDEEILAQVLELCEVANEELHLAREGFMTSFQFGLYPLAVRGYLEILVAARRDTEAVRFGVLVSQKGQAAEDPEAGRLLIDLLGRKGDWQHASQLAASWVRSEQPLDAELLRLMCYSIYRGKRWNNIFGAANRLRSIGSTDDEAIASLYNGFGYAGTKTPNVDLALRNLETFARGRTPDPFPGARAAAWVRISQLYGDLGDTNREREALQAVLSADPEFSGELWLRSAEIQLETRHSGYLLPLTSWAKAMSLLPKRTDELLPTFEELGKKALAAQDRDVQLIFEEIARRNLTVPRRDYGPYVLLKLAQIHGGRGNAPAQAALARRLLDEYPGFLPAHDQLIASQLASGNRREYVELIVQRAEIAGLDDRTLSLLAGVTEDEYRAGQVVRMMQADTKGTGRVVVAKWLYRHGDTSAALETLRSAGKSKRSEHELLLGAQIEIENGRYREALNWLDALPKDGVRIRERRINSLLCSLHIGDRARIRELAGEIFEREAPSLEETFKLADVFLRLGELQGALQILDGLEDKRGVDPAGLLLRRSLVFLARGDHQAAELEIDRAEPFLTEAQSTVLRLLLDGQREDWIACARTAEQLFELAPPEDPEFAGLLFLLNGNEDEAMELADFALELAPQSLAWTLASSIARLREGHQLALTPDFGERGEAQTRRFLAGILNNERDTRQVIPLLLATVLPEFHPYLQGELRSLDTKVRGRLWPRILEAALLMEMEREEEAQPILEMLAASFPDCLPAWERLERAYAKRLGSPDHPQVLEIRAKRLDLIARAYPEGSEAVLIDGAAALEQGDLGRAFRLTSSVVTERPDWVTAQVQLARVQTAMRNWTDARVTWRWITRNDDAELARRAVWDFIEMLETAHASPEDPLPREGIVEELTELSKNHPTDPRPTLALARLDLTMDLSNPAIGVARALGRLQSFRDEHPGLSLEKLQRGATSSWSEFYVEVDPSAAVSFLTQELELEPGDTELWRLLGRVYRELGELTESARFLMRAGRMTPEPSIQLELARTLVSTGSDPRVVMGPLRTARRATGGRDSVDAQLLLAEATLNQISPKSWAAAVESLQPLWDSRADLQRSEDKARLAELYGRALLLRGQPGDAQSAQRVLISQLKRAEPLYQSEAMKVLIAVAKSLREPSE